MAQHVGWVLLICFPTLVPSTETVLMSDHVQHVQIHPEIPPHKPSYARPIKAHLVPNEHSLVLCKWAFFSPIYMEVSWNRGTPKTSILMGFSTTNHLFLETPHDELETPHFHVMFLAKRQGRSREKMVSKAPQEWSASESWIFWRSFKGLLFEHRVFLENSEKHLLNKNLSECVWTSCFLPHVFTFPSGSRVSMNLLRFAHAGPDGDFRPCKSEQRSIFKWGFPKTGVPQNGWFIVENPI